MALSRNVPLPAVLLMILAGLVAGSTFISDNVYESYGSAGRSLLQAKTSCSIDFENMNYTIVTSKCKGPQYPAKLCCAAFKEFACPYADQLNDDTNDCASTMFSYVNLYGKYPPGLFASECREGKEGLACPDSTSANDKPSAGLGAPSLTSPMLLVCGTIITFLCCWN